MSARKAVHALGTKWRGRARCGVKVEAHWLALVPESVTCERCRSILEGKRRVGNVEEVSS